MRIAKANVPLAQRQGSHSQQRHRDADSRACRSKLAAAGCESGAIAAGPRSVRDRLAARRGESVASPASSVSADTADAEWLREPHRGGAQPDAVDTSCPDTGGGPAWRPGYRQERERGPSAGAPSYSRHLCHSVTSCSK